MPLKAHNFLYSRANVPSGRLLPSNTASVRLPIAPPCICTGIVRMFCRSGSRGGRASWIGVFSIFASPSCGSAMMRPAGKGVPVLTSCKMMLSPSISTIRSARWAGASVITSIFSGRQTAPSCAIKVAAAPPILILNTRALAALISRSRTRDPGLADRLGFEVPFTVNQLPSRPPCDQSCKLPKDAASICPS